MARMQIQARNDFAADTLTTHAMLTDPAFLAQVCEASGDLDYRVGGVPEHTAVQRTLEAPSAVRSLLGDRLTLLQEIRWNAADATGARTGDLELTVQGMPARAQLTIDLRAGGRGTVVDFVGEFTIKVPLVGRSLEGKAAPALTAGFDVQQQVGDKWLAERS